MWCIPDQKRLDAIPKLYSTEDIPFKDTLIYLHFFIFGCDWYVAEFDGIDTLFGYAVINGDLELAEWGYFSFAELRNINIGGFEVDCESDLFWKIKPFGEINLHASKEFEGGSSCTVTNLMHLD